jgi:hypothetical protein
VTDPLGGNTDPFAPFLDSHTPWASPLREHKTDPANPMGDSESGPDLHHVRVVGNKAKRHDYDAGLYFSGCYDTQTFWAPAGRGGGGYVGGPEVTRPDQRQWELEKAATLRKFVDRLDDVWVRIVDHAWENPGAQFVSVWTEADALCLRRPASTSARTPRAWSLPVSGTSSSRRCGRRTGSAKCARGWPRPVSGRLNLRYRP